MQTELFYSPSNASVWLTTAVVLIALMIAVEVGFRFGSRVRRRKRETGDAELDLGTIQGSLLGLLGLLLAFTYAFVAARADARKQAVVEEANAIGTAYLRAGLLPGAQGIELQRLLKEYAKTRIVEDDVAGNPAKVPAALAESDRAQARLWPTAAKSLEGRAPTPLDSILFQSLNEVIDSHARRVAAARDRLPTVIFALLAFVAIVSVGATGFASGLVGRRHLFLNTILPLIVAAVIGVIVDLDVPRGGFIRVSQQALRETVQSMDSPATSMP